MWATRCSSRRLPQQVLFALLLAGCIFGGYQQLFSTFASYDDEGYMMLSLDGYRRVGGLYDRVFSQYGPAYYVLQSAVHDWTGLPIAHDVSRWRTLVLWSITCLAISAATWRLAHSAFIATITLAISFHHLDRLALEPGHPQEWCVLLITGVCLLSTLATKEKIPSKLTLIAIGLACGTLGMMKANIGALAAIAVTLSMLLQMRSSRWQRITLLAVSTLACLLPWLIMRSQLHDPSALRFATLVSASTFMLVVQASGDSGTETRFGWNALGLFVLSCLASAAAFATAAVLNGTSWNGLVHGLVLQHARFGEAAFYRPAPLPSWTGVWLLAVLVLFVLNRQHASIACWVRLVIAVLVPVTIVLHMFEAARPLLYGTIDRGGSAYWLALVTPAVWAILPANNGTNRRWPMLLLAFAAVLQSLGAFPVPGTQMAIGTLLLIALGAIALHSSITDEQLHRIWFARRRQACALLLACLLAAVALRDVVSLTRRYQYEPLNLPGTAGLRLPAAQVRQWQWLTGELRARADTFVFRVHTRGSLYYWTKLEPPTWCNATCWPYLLGDEHQRAVLKAMAHAERVCMVDEPYSAPLPVQTSPLLNYLDRRFVPVAFADHFRVAEEESRQLELSSDDKTESSGG